MPTAIDVANYFLATLGAQPESDLTPMKLQKLCAYSQALALALLDRPIFAEKIEAWPYGPVIPTVYRQFSEYSRRIIPRQGLSGEHARAPFSDEEKFVLELCKNYYGIFSASELSNRSHRDFPGQFGSKKIIENDAIKKAFMSSPLVRKIRTQAVPRPYNEETDRLVSEQDIWDALAI